MDVDQGLGAAGADPRGVGLGQHRPNRGKCTTPHTHLVTTWFWCMLYNFRSNLFIGINIIRDNNK